MMSLMAVCRAALSTDLHTCISAHDVQLGRRPLHIGVDHRYRAQRVSSRRYPAATLTASLSNPNPQAVNGMVYNQSPACGAIRHQRSKYGFAKRVTASIPHNRLVMVDQRSIPESLLFRHRVHHCRERIFTRLHHFVLVCVDPFLCIKDGSHEQDGRCTRRQIG